MANPLTQAYSGGSVGTGAGKAGGERAPSPGAARRPSSGGDKKHPDATKDAVRTMQQLMGKLNTDLQTGDAADIALRKIQEVNNGILPDSFNSADKIKAAVRSWGATSAGGTTGSYDGIWGPNTKAQLERIKKFITDTKLSGMIIQEGNGVSPYQTMSPEELKKIAEDNIANLSRLFESIGMSSPNIGAKGNLSSFPLDRIKAELTTEDATTPQPWPDHAGDIRVTVGDMRSLVRFFQFIQQLKYTKCRPLEGGNRESSNRGRQSNPANVKTFADIILDDSLIRWAQRRENVPGQIDAQRGYGAGEAAKRSYEADSARRDNESKETPKTTEQQPQEEKTKPQEVEGQWHCFYTVDDIFRWFASRARMVLAQIQDLIAERKPHPFYPNRLVNEQDEAAATAYLSAANGLWEQWSGMKRNVIRQIQQSGNSDNPQVTLEMIMDGGAGSLPTPGAGRRRSEDRGEGRRGIGAETISYDGGGGEDSIRQRSLRGPIREFMPLNWLLESDEFRDLGVDTSKLEQLSKDNRIPDIHRQVWRQGNWVNLAIQNIEGNSNTEKLNKFSKWAGAIRDVLYELYANWESSNRANLSEQIIAQQNRELNRWGDAITSIISRSQRGMPDAVKRYGD